MRELLLLKWSPTLLLALSLGAPGQASGPTPGDPDTGSKAAVCGPHGQACQPVAQTQPSLAGDSHPVTVLGAAEHASYGVVGPYASYGLASSAARYLESYGYYTTMRYDAGWWYVFYW
jgi:hypothetical protein